VSRYESGHVLPVWSTVLALAHFYGVTKEELAHAAQLWERARDEPKPVRLPAGADKAFRRLVNAEREADGLRVLATEVVPGLLQVRPYIDALFEAARHFHSPALNVETAAAVRLGRQDRLTGPEPMALHVVLDESAVRREVGGPAVLREQLAHLLAMGELPHVTIQVVPFSAGAYALSSGRFVLVDYSGENEPSNVYVEYPAGGAWLEDGKTVRGLAALFEDAAKTALSPGDSAHLIQRRIEVLSAPG
jgi:hypothetical protein